MPFNAICGSSHAVTGNTWDLMRASCGGDVSDLNLLNGNWGTALTHSIMTGNDGRGKWLHVRGIISSAQCQDLLPTDGQRGIRKSVGVRHWVRQAHRNEIDAVWKSKHSYRQELKSVTPVSRKDARETHQVRVQSPGTMFTDRNRTNRSHGCPERPWCAYPSAIQSCKN